MKIEVPHHPDSEKYIQKTFSQYKKIDKIPNYIKGQCVIHMYPIEDTIDKGINNELSGYIDAYNCKVHIYDCAKKTVYKEKYHDQIMVDVKSRVRIFKDLSTAIIISQPITFINGQSLWVRPLEE